MELLGGDNYYNAAKLLLKVADLSSYFEPQLRGHNLRVAVIATQLASKLSYSQEFLKKVLVASLFHDIGILFQNREEQKKLLKREIAEDKKVHLHAYFGFELFKRYPKFRGIALAIRDHHRSYKEFVENPGKYSFASQVIHLADRIDVWITNRLERGLKFPNVLSEVREKLIENKGTLFDPELVDILIQNFFDKEYFWFVTYLSETYLGELIAEWMINLNFTWSIDEFIKFVDIFGFIIDFKSPFTATHSTGVAQTAIHLSSLLGFSPTELKKIKIAAFLHDIGKIFIPSEILEKPAKLTEEEFFIMKSHVFHTYMILNSSIKDKDIVFWASYHHEKLDGSGYPFRIKADQIPLGSRIMAVADIFTALTEERPYKKSLSPSEAIKLIGDLANKNFLDRKVVYTLRKNLDTINKSKNIAQERARELYNLFREIFKSFEN